MDKNVLSKVAAIVERRSRLNSCKALVKRAQAEAEIDYKARRKKLRLLLGAALGGAAGLRMAYAREGLSNPDGSDTPISKKNLAIGGGLGALGGLGAAAISNGVRDWAGLDPMGQVVTVGK